MTHLGLVQMAYGRWLLSLDATLDVNDGLLRNLDALATVHPSLARFNPYTAWRNVPAPVRGLSRSVIPAGDYVRLDKPRLRSEEGVDEWLLVHTPVPALEDFALTVGSRFHATPPLADPEELATLDRIG